MHQRIDQRATLLLHSDSDGPTGEPIPQQLNPALQGVWRLIQGETLALASVAVLQGDNVFLVRPIQSDKCGDLNILFRHLQTSPWFPWLKTIPAGSAHNPYSRVLEGHHLSIRSASRADRVRKSPSTVNPVGWTIRNATRPVFHKGNSSKKEKEKRTKKEKENGLWKMPQLWKSANQSVAFGNLFLMRIPTAAWKSLAKALGFSTFTTGPATIDNHGTNFHS
jgi:hypothetical protein